MHGPTRRQGVKDHTRPNSVPLTPPRNSWPLSRRADTRVLVIIPGRAKVALVFQALHDRSPSL
jgi:hypothetical protein